MKNAKFILLLFLLLSLISCKAENKIQTVAKQVSEEIMEQYEPLEGVMTLVADAKTGDIIASVDLGGLRVNLGNLDFAYYSVGAQCCLKGN